MSAQQTYRLNRPVFWQEGASIVGPKEAAGPLGQYFDESVQDDTLGKKSFEESEIELQRRVTDLVLMKAGIGEGDVSFLLAGDLLNQVVAAGFSARTLKMPFLGLYGACSTMAESMILGSLLLSGGYGERAVCVASSHFSSAERQYRYPLEMGTQRPPTSQWTVTGAGAALLSTVTVCPLVLSEVTIGRVIDMGITDANNMGAAMAPAAADTLTAHFADTGRDTGFYDLIVTGDLGQVGSELLRQLLAQKGIDLGPKHYDCGCEIFKGDEGAAAGGSGCGCSAVTLMSYLRREMIEGRLNRILFMATGALLSPVTSQQGESIPSIAHAAVIERKDTACG